ncbi:MAG: hydroxyacid dehydrogenase [Pseudorhodoplanes sp.]
MIHPPRQFSYIGKQIDPVFDRTIEACPGLSLHRIDRTRPFSELRETLAASQAIQIDSAASDIPDHLRIGPDLLAACPDLLAVSASGAGFDTVDVAACTGAGVIVVNQSGGNSESVAEHTLGMMLALTKRIAETDRAMRDRGIADRVKFMGHELHGRSIGIIGIGHCGSRVAELCRGLFAMTVLAFDPYVSAEAIAALGARKVSLPELLSESDFVSLHCPLNAETSGMIGADEFARMKPGAYFVSTARGGIHDEQALHTALCAGRLAGAGLDVWAQEPPPADHPLLSLRNVIASPHTAGVTHEARHRLARMAAEQLIAIFRGEKPERLVNPEAWPLFLQRFDTTARAARRA